MSEYKNIEKIKPETLLALMREVLDQTTEFIYILMAHNHFLCPLMIKNIMFT